MTPRRDLSAKQLQVLLAVRDAGPAPQTELDIYDYGYRKRWWSAVGLHGFLAKLHAKGYVERIGRSPYRYVLTDEGRALTRDMASHIRAQVTGWAWR